MSLEMVEIINAFWDYHTKLILKNVDVVPVEVAKCIARDFIDRIDAGSNQNPRD